MPLTDAGGMVWATRARLDGGVVSSPKQLLWWLGLALLALSWLPTDHYPPWVSFHSELLAFAGFFLLLAACLARGAAVTRLPRTVLVLVTLATLPWLQWLAGVNGYAGDALLSSFYLLGLAAAVLVGFRVGPEGINGGGGDDPLLGLMHVLWMGALVSAAIALVQWLDVADAFEMLSSLMLQPGAGQRAIGNLGQPNQLATLLLMGLVALTYVRHRRAIGGVGFGVAAAFITWGLVLSESRTGLLSGVAVAAFLVWKGRRHDFAAGPRTVMAWAVVFVAAFFLFPWIGDLLHLGRGRGIPLADNGTRWQLWQQMAAGIWAAPWWGYGWNLSSSAHIAGAAIVPGSLTLNYAHNIFLDLLAWNGIPLGLLLILALLYWLGSRLRDCRAPHAILAMACLLPVFIHGLLEFPFAYSYFLLFAGAMAGVVEVARERRPTGAVVRTRWLWGAGAAAAAVGAFLAYEYLLIEKDFRVVRFEGASIGVTALDYRPPTIRLNTHLAAMLRAARMQPRPGMNAQEVEVLRDVAARFPYRTLSFRYALALGLNGDAAAATRQLASIRNLYGADEYAVVKTQLGAYAQRYPVLQNVLVP